MSEQPLVGVIVPSWQEEETIGPLLEALKNAAPEARVLVVDDSPNERTVDAARATGHPGLQVLHRKGKGGRGTAVLDGMTPTSPIPRSRSRSWWTPRSARNWTWSSPAGTCPGGGW
ncbi:MAG: glycosyltransferase [Deltaproteobacteria bacterium]|nr:glycosyltransferase [Deltaproteobacteria bacterium]